MAPAVVFMIASCLPTQVKTVIDRTVAARKADPEHWQTKPIPPIRMLMEPLGERVRRPRLVLSPDGRLIDPEKEVDPNERSRPQRLDENPEDLKKR